MDEIEPVFSKSRRNQRTESAALKVLLEDRRFQRPELATKRKIIDLLPVSGDWGVQTFDAIMTPAPAGPVTADNLGEHLDLLKLVEMKSTRKPIKDPALNGFFFGATEREYAMAEALGDRYLFAFIVLNDNNIFGRPFFALLSLEDVVSRTRSKRVQYQVNFRTDIVLEGPGPQHGIGPTGIARSNSD